MAPGLIYSLPQDELREALHNERAAASSTTPPSCQASKALNAVEIESPVQKMASPPGADAQATTAQDAEKVLLLESGFVEQLKKTLDFSAVQNRQLDELLNTCQGQLYCLPMAAFVPFAEPMLIASLFSHYEAAPRQSLLGELAAAQDLRRRQAASRRDNQEGCTISSHGGRLHRV